MAMGKTFYKKIMPTLKDKDKEKLKKNITIDPVNISQTVNYLKSNTVDAGLLYDSTAKANKA